jgi:glycosyltransferase involved in cell wall biosynthesis
MRKERSGLAFTTLEIVAAEEKQGHTVCVREPSSGDVLYGNSIDKPDVELIHSQINMACYHNGTPKFLFCHGEPLSSVGNGVSMKAIVDLAPICDAFICMRKEEHAYWSLLKRTYCVSKGIDLEMFRPLPAIEAGEKLEGSPAVLYMEHWRGQRNPLPLVVAMAEVVKKYPDARLHLWNCTDKKMLETFQALIKAAKLWPYVRSLQGPVEPKDVNKLLNRADVVVSCLYPLYARSIEALGAGKAFICPGYTDPNYEWHCTLDPSSMANEIVRCWENYDKVNYRKWAEDHHDVQETVRQSLAVYQRYI